MRALRHIAITAAFFAAPLIASAQTGSEAGEATSSIRNESTSVVLTEQGRRREATVTELGAVDAAAAHAMQRRTVDKPQCSAMENLLAAARAAVLAAACREPNGNCTSLRPDESTAPCVIAKGKLP